MPRFLGEGAFSHAFRTRDGKYVIKRLKPQLLGTPLTHAERAEMAGRYVASIEILRGAGLPVSATSRADRHPHMIVQRFARRGVRFRELPVAAKVRALASAIAITARAWYHLERAGARSVFVDPFPWNMRFDRSGRVVEWFDPIGPFSFTRWIRIQLRSLVSGDRGPPGRRTTPAGSVARSPWDPGISGSEVKASTRRGTGSSARRAGPIPGKAGTRRPARGRPTR